MSNIDVLYVQGIIRPEDANRYKSALQGFTVPDNDKLIVRNDNSVRQHPIPEVEGYFEWVSKHGKPVVPWDILRPVFLWKLKFVMDEMVRMDNEKGDTGIDSEEKSQISQLYDSIMLMAESLEGPPFTWQRLCELLNTPSRHYKRARKFLRAIDKTINVVTTVTEAGVRVTGGDWPLPYDPSTNGKIEQQFFGRVDEIDVDAADEKDAVKHEAPLDMTTKKIDSDESGDSAESSDTPMAEPVSDAKSEPMEV